MAKFDIITPHGVALDVKDAVLEVLVSPHNINQLQNLEFLGRLVQELVNCGALNHGALVRLFPPDYIVRHL